MKRTLRAGSAVVVWAIALVVAALRASSASPWSALAWWVGVLFGAAAIIGLFLLSARTVSNPLGLQLLACYLGGLGIRVAWVARFGNPFGSLLPLWVLLGLERLEGGTGGLLLQLTDLAGPLLIVLLVHVLLGRRLSDQKEAAGDLP